MSQQEVFTIGYEGAELASFLATLENARISLVIDVRALAISRKRGFSKKSLSQALSSRQIDYVHIKELGDPKPGREAARRGDFATFREIYASHLERADTQAALKLAGQLRAKNATCLLCFERAPEHCHRTMIANVLARRECLKVRHLRVTEIAKPPLIVPHADRRPAALG